MQHIPMKHVMFHANDVKKHDVYWSEEGQHFAIENFEEGFIRGHDTLCGALTHMHCVTSDCVGYGKDYVAQVPNRWTMSDSPY